MEALLDRNMDRMVFDPPELGCILRLSGLPGAGNKIYDRSPYGNHGTITGAVWKKSPGPSAEGWYLDFDGSDDKVNCGHGASLLFNGGSFTYRCWFWLDTLPSAKAAHEALAGRVDDTGAASGRGCVTIADRWTDKLRVIFYDGVNAPASIYSNSTLSTGRWYCAEVVYNKSTQELSMWVNAVKQSNIASFAQSSDASTNHDLMIGAHSASSQFTDGRIALPEVYKQAANALDIQRRFDREKYFFVV